MRKMIFSMDIHDEATIQYYGWVVVISGMIILAVAVGIVHTFGVFFEPMLAEFKCTRSELSGVFSTYAIVHIFASIGLGYLADRFGIRAVVIICSPIAAISLYLTSILTTLWQLYLCWGFVFSIGISCAYVPITSTIPKWFRQKRGLAMGITVMGLGFGALIIPPLAGFLVSSYGWRYSYTILGCILLISLTAPGLFLKKRQENWGNEKNAQTSNDSRKSLMDDSCTLRQAFFTKAFWMQGISWFFLALALYAVLIHLVPYAISVGISSIQASAILGLAGGCSVLGRLGMGSVSDKLGRKNSLVIGAVIKIMALLWLLITTKLWMFYLFSFVFGFSYGAWGALMPAMTADNFGQRNSGAIFGTMFLFPGTGVSIGPLAAGYAIDLTQSYYYMFLITIGASVLGLVFSLLIVPTKR